MTETVSEHDTWISRVCDHLNKLIQLDYDALQTYKVALMHVDDAAVWSDLQTFLCDHERHILELTGIICELGGTPIEPHRDFKGMLLEGMTKLRSRKGTLGALRAMRTNEKLTNRVYDKEASVYMPPLCQAVALENLADERRHLAAIEAHIDRLTGKQYYEVDRVDREASEYLYPPL